MSGLSAPETSGTASDPNLDLLKLMADPTALAARIKDYEAAKAAADASIALVAPANEIISLRAETQRLRAEAGDYLNKNRADGDAILADAKKMALEITASAQDLRASALQDAAVAHAEATEVRNTSAQTKVDADAYAASVRSSADDVHAKLTAALADAQSEKQRHAENANVAAASKRKLDAKLAAINAAALGD